MKNLFASPLITVWLFLFIAFSVINSPAFALDLDFGPKWNPKTIASIEKNFGSSQITSGITQMFFTFARLNRDDGANLADLLSIGGSILQDVQEGSPNMDGKFSFGLGGDLTESESPMKIYGALGLNYHPVRTEDRLGAFFGLSGKF